MGFDGLAALIRWNWKLIARWEPVFYTKYRNFLIHFVIFEKRPRRGKIRDTLHNDGGESSGGGNRKRLMAERPINFERGIAWHIFILI